MNRKLLLSPLLLLAACSVDPAANPAAVLCSLTSDCPSGQECYQGYCIPLVAPDAGEPTDLGVPDATEAFDCLEYEDGEIVECYTDTTTTTANVGVCKTGLKECRNGKFGGCLGQVLPSPELCNGKDDDCNGEDDDIFPLSCEVAGALGVCQAGTIQCVGPNAVCVSTSSATTEICDAFDNDCDGDTNEDLVRPCFGGAQGCEQDRVDGKFTCTGACQSGTQTCEMAGTWTACTGDTRPVPETCTSTVNAVAQDENCDGTIDEDCTCVEGASYACYTGPAGTDTNLPCRRGLSLCENDQLGPCKGEIVPVVEDCTNELSDDDCDGMPDDVLGRGSSCTSTLQGECRDGTLICGPTGLECLTAQPIDELCNGRDDDCNGVNDNGFDLLTDELNCGMCGVPCADELSCCGGGCVDTDNDPQNCGTCGNNCGQGGLCCNGQCVPNPMSDRNNCGGCGIPCNGIGQECCNGTCIDTRSNPMACGSCTTQCGGTNSACCNSQCAPPVSAQCNSCGAPCGGTETCCAPVCANLQTDTSNCGACGVDCADGQFCCNGQCRNNDEQNCGMCGRSCGANEHCCGGNCVPVNAQNCQDCADTCGDGESCCGTASGCQPTNADPNCGACGVNCAAAGQLCTNRTCCAPGLTGCGVDTCANLMNDEDNCGQCGRSCEGLLGLGAACSSGQCCVTVLFITTCQ